MRHMKTRQERRAQKEFSHRKEGVLYGLNIGGYRLKRNALPSEYSDFMLKYQRCWKKHRSTQYK